MGADRLFALGVALALVWTAPCAKGGEVLDAVKSRGLLRCGVSEGIAGFSEKDAAGRWQGFDVDICRAVAAAVLGDPERVELVPLMASARFPALQGRRIDLLTRNTTWTLVREAALGVQFPAVVFYDGQGVMVPAASKVTRLEQLQDATVCVVKGTNDKRNLERFAARTGLSFQPLTFDSGREVAEAFFAGRCSAYTSDASQLAAARLSAPGGADAFVILPERISKEPLSPAVWGGDTAWATVVRWVAFALMLAEEEGIDRANVLERANAETGEMAGLGSRDRELIGASLGLKPGWAVRAVQAVGNYGELYDRHFGSGGRLAIERGPNRLWTQGGLMYAPPID